MLVRLLQSDSHLIPTVLSTLYRLEQTMPTGELLDEVLRIAQNRTVYRQQRVQALAIAARSDLELDSAAIRYACAHIVGDEFPETRALAAEVLLNSNLDAAAFSILIETLPKIGPMELGQLLATFRQSQDDEIGLAVVDALGQCPAAEALTRESLTESLGGFSGAVSTRLQELLTRLDAARVDKIAQIDAIASLLDKADVRRGQAVFNSAKASCRACHEMGYLGGNVGPDLTRIGRIRSERDLLEAILYPSLSFVRSYEPVQIVTTSGKVYSGLVQDESGESVTLAIDAQKKVQIRHAQVELRQPGKVSVMPAGLEKQLTAQELADVVKFLHAAR
jgi:putative heme-binding domain-containing protein